MADWPTRTRRDQRALCGCGKPRTVQVQAIAAKRVGGYEQLGSTSRTLCEDCARDIFDKASELIEGAATHG